MVGTNGRKNVLLFYCVIMPNQFSKGYLVLAQSSFSALNEPDGLF